MDFKLFIPLLFSLQFFYWFVGHRSARHLRDQEDYFLAGKSVKMFPLMMTFIATQVGGGLVLGAAEEAYKYGWSVLLYPVGAALGLIVLGLGIGAKLANFKVSTVAQVLEIVYKSSLLKKIASVLSITSLFMVLVAQIIASAKFLTTIGFSSTPLFILFWAIVIFYTAHGGLKAVISTDLIQATFFIFVFIASIVFVVLKGGSSLTSVSLDTTSSAVSSKLCGWLLMPLLFMIIEQDMGQRCFAGGSSKAVSQATLGAGIVIMLVCCIPVFFGILAKASGIEIPQGQSVLMAGITHLTNPWITAFMGCAILAAIISTATSLINAISSNISSDFSLNWIEKFNPVSAVRMITMVISTAAIVFAFYFDNIVDVLLHSYELSVSCLFVPIFLGLFIKRGNTASAALAMALGAIGFCLLRIYPIAFPREVVSIMLSFLGFGVGEVLVWRQNKNRAQLS